MSFVNKETVKVQIEAFRGAQGPVGPAGPQGVQGLRGAVGPAGPVGLTGPKGDKGEKGERGATGATGATGPQGETGPQGATGPQGPRGEKGDQGEQGPQGPAGPAGPGGGAAIDDTTPSATTTYSSTKIDALLNEQKEANVVQDTAIAKKANDADLATVAKSGSYNDLKNKPTIPAAYTLPVASSSVLGGVKPAAKTDDMTQGVGVDANGQLFTAPGSGGGLSGEWKKIVDFTTTEQVKSFQVTEDINGNPLNVQGEAKIFFIAAPNGSAKADTRFSINGQEFGHLTDTIYDTNYYTRRRVEVGAYPNGFFAFDNGFEYSSDNNVEKTWARMKGAYLYDYYSSSFRNGINSIKYMTISETANFGVGSKIVVYVKE